MQLSLQFSQHLTPDEGRYFSNKKTSPILVQQFVTIDGCDRISHIFFVMKAEDRGGAPSPPVGEQGAPWQKG
ncbi:hypothetical protein [Fischerella thermalis]|uniref:hypothetical protein n=1 Tax=Fischerella thermalis TaxID=372787 RepID=UPI000C7FDEC9|nr:hypothetical protein [Fischerella thermalis]MBF1990439.1 hypothetical protein [Fischerella thermalis M58_A2018_009]MBF2071227.1 hypothetical protein [Fischerella thermalis M48_A2018_028]PLZ85632.1 hypothetical protein CI593_20590 [Fischerella thermalis CCMEE 5194]